MTKSMLLTMSLALAACWIEAADTYEAPARLHLPGEAVADSFGQMGNGAAQQVGRVQVAVLSSSGRFLAVGDRYGGPFIQVFDRVTRSVVKFGEKGTGPGELQNLYALEFVSDSILLILGAGGRLLRYDVGGEWLGGYRDSHAGLTIATITSGCSGRVYAHGIERTERGGRRDSLPWIHELFLDSALTSEARVTLPIPASSMKWGALYGFDGTDDGLVVWDQDAMIGYWAPCDAADADVWHRAVAADATARAAVGGMALRLPDTLFAGAVARRSEKYMAQTWKERGTDITALRKVAEARCSEVELFGLWTIHDAHPDGLVMATEVPYPAVKIVSWEWLNEQFRRARCS